MHEPVYYTTNAGMYCKRCGRTAIASSTATTSSEFKQCIQPIMDGHAPTMVNNQWGSIVLFYLSQVYCTTNAGMYCKRCAIAFGTATTSSEFKMCIQPIMDGHAPTMDNNQWQFMVLFTMSP